jgi:hypothetical protein
MKFLPTTIVVLAACGVFTNAAFAQERTVYFSGVLSAVENSPFPDVVEGTPFAGSYTFDVSTEDSNPLDQIGGYRHTAAPYGVTVTIGAHTFRTDPSNVDFLVEVTNDYQSLDNLAFRSYRNVSSNGVPIEIISCQFDDPTHAILGSSELPTGIPDLSRWQQWIGLDISGGAAESRFMLRGRLTAVQFAPTEF